MGRIYSDAQRSLAKSLWIASSNRKVTLRLLEEAWADEDVPLPSPRTLSLWKADDSIPVDAEIVQGFADKARAGIIAASERLAGKIGKTVEVANQRYIDGQGNALDILNVTKSFGILADKLNGRYGNAPGVVHSAAQVFTGPVQIVAWAPKEAPPPRETLLEIDA